MDRLSDWFLWSKKNWFLFLCLGLLIFIAFFPKLPLFDLIPGYIVRVRLEDIFLGFVTVILGIRVLQGKASLKTPLTSVLIFYTLIGLASVTSALFIINTVPLDFLHVGKMILHFLRRLEYFVVFFLFYNAVKSYRHAQVVVIAMVLILVGISTYGFGQKYLYWPVYSTMNREFSKGMRLVLTEHARVPSTFGGHYDMSAFVMIILTLILSFIFLSRHLWEKILLSMVYVAGFWLLVLGASRSSFLAYLLSTSLLVLFVGVHKRSFLWTISRGVTVIGLSLVVMVTFGDLSSRFSQLGIVKQIQTSLDTLLKPVSEQPTNSIAIDPLDETDQLPLPAVTESPTITMKPTETLVPLRSLPPDVYKDIPDRKVVTATIGGELVTNVIEVPRIFSDCSYIYGLSACIRFEALWPRALNGFVRNPLIGSGYSTLTKVEKAEFTEAESTDNDFLRTLGEVGILGTIGFYGCIVLFFRRALKDFSKKQTNLVFAIVLGILAASLGLLFNALYIDVFAASKVAFLYWSLIGVGFAALELSVKRLEKHEK